MTAPRSLDAQRRLGNPGRRSLREPVSIAPDIPPPPPTLGERGRDAWQLFWRVGWVAPTDRILILLLAEALDMRELLRADLAASGSYAKGSTGQLVAHPAVKVLADLEGRITDWLVMGLFTPQSRLHVGVKQARTTPTKLETLRASRRTPDAS